MTKKKLAAVVIALVMVLTMASSAFAATGITILINPSDVTAIPGSTASFSVAATGGTTMFGSAYSYQWYISTNGGSSFDAIIGGTSSTLSFTVSAEMNGNMYYCKVSDMAGASATSSVAKLSTGTGSAFTLTVVGGTGSGSYKAGTLVSITANPSSNGMAFDYWSTSNGGTFTAQTLATTTFIMPAATTTITAHYKNGGTSGTTGTLTQLTLTDPTTRLSVSGNMMSNSTITVTSGAAHNGDSACAAIQSYQTAGNLYCLYNVGIAAPGVSGNAFMGVVNVNIPVNAKNGTSVTVYHCHNGSLQQVNAYVTNGYVAVQNDTVGVFAVGGATGGTVTPTPPSVTPPQTGDTGITTYAVIGIGLGFVALACVIALNSKKEN